MIGQSYRRSRHGAGFSLIELMLALALGLVIVTGIVQLFVSNSQTYTVLNGQARMQENARFALEFISRGARSAGYYGCLRDPQNLVKGLAGDWGLIPEVDVSRPVQGYEGNPGGTWTPGLLTLPRSDVVDANVRYKGQGIDSRVIAPGTDVVVFRGLRQPGARLAQVLQPDGTPVVVAPGGDAGIAVNDVVMIVNCEQSAVVRVTGIATTSTEATLLLATGATATTSADGPAEVFFRNAATIDSPTGNVPFTLSFLGRSYGEDAVVSVVESTYFFIAPGLGQNNLGATPLALWQKVGTAAPAELVQGVENLQVLYGIDTTLNDQVPNANRYVTANNVPDPSQVVSVRISLTVNSVDAVDGEEQLRRTVSKTIVLRNSNPGA